MKIQYMSDLHLEFRGLNFKNLFNFAAPVLCLVGDICASGNKTDFAILVKFLEYICPKYKYVIHVAGNHEYYSEFTAIKRSDTIKDINIKLKNLSQRFPNYHFLNKNVLEITENNDTYLFIGATLWTYIEPKYYNEIQSNMNDYNNIYVKDNSVPNSVRKFTVQDMQKKHRSAIRYIKNIIKAINSYHKNKYKNVILLTHHKPIIDTKINDSNVLTMAYETDIMRHIINSPIKVAIHGHTHKPYDKTINGIRFLSNPKGYISQKTMFNKTLTIDI